MRAAAARLGCLRVLGLQVADGLCNLSERVHLAVARRECVLQLAVLRLQRAQLWTRGVAWAWGWRGLPAAVCPAGWRKCAAAVHY